MKRIFRKISLAWLLAPLGITDSVLATDSDEELLTLSFTKVEFKAFLLVL